MYVPMMKLIVYFFMVLPLLLTACRQTPAEDAGPALPFGTQADTLFRQAARRQEVRDFPAAIALYKQVFALRPPSDEAVREAGPVVKEALMQLMYCHFFSGVRGSAAAWYTAFAADTAHWMVRLWPRTVEVCLGYSLYEAARLPEAVAVMERALARPEEGIPPGELYADYGIAGAIFNQTGDIPRAIACTERCAALLRTLGKEESLVNALGNLILQYQQIGMLERSLAAYEELTALPAAAASPYHRCIAEVNVVHLFDEWGLEDEVEKHLAIAREAADTCGIPEARLRVRNLAVLLLLERGRVAEAVRVLDTLATLLPEEATESFYRIYYRDYRLVAGLSADSAAVAPSAASPGGGSLSAHTAGGDVRALALARLRELEAAPMDRLTCDVCYLLGQAFARRGQTQAAIRAYEACEPYTGKNHLLNYRRMVCRELAQLYARTGDYATAARYYERYDTANAAFTERRRAGMMAQFRVRYETREKEQANVLLRAEVQLQRRTLQYYTLVGVAAALLLLVVLTWAVMRHRSLRQQHELDVRRHELDVMRHEEAGRLIHAQELKLRGMLRERLELNRKNEALRAELQSGSTDQQLRRLMECLSPRLLTSKEEQEFRRQFLLLHPSFITRLRRDYPTLSRGEELMAMLIRLGLTNEEIALTLGIHRGSVNTSRSRLRRKFALRAGDSLEDFMKRLEEDDGEEA